MTCFVLFTALLVGGLRQRKTDQPGPRTKWAQKVPAEPQDEREGSGR